MSWGCPMCGSKGVWIGQVGWTTHLRCRMCGWDWSVEDRRTTVELTAEQLELAFEAMFEDEQ